MKCINYERKATMFVTSVLSLNADDVKIMRPIQDKYGLIPSLAEGVTLTVSEKGISPTKTVTLELKSLDEQLAIKFGDQRVDILQSAKMGDELRDMDQFVRKALNIFAELADMYKLSINRVALCGSYLYEIDVDKLCDVYQSLFKTDEKPINWAHRKVVRHVVDDLAQINEVYVFGVKQQKLEDEIRDVLVLDTDLNTVAGTKTYSHEECEKLFNTFLLNQNFAIEKLSKDVRTAINPR